MFDEDISSELNASLLSFFILLDMLLSDSLSAPTRLRRMLGARSVSPISATVRLGSSPLAVEISTAASAAVAAAEGVLVTELLFVAVVVVVVVGNRSCLALKCLMPRKRLCGRICSVSAPMASMPSLSLISVLLLLVGLQFVC